jgi:AraC-like DNA-binding protein
VFDLPGAHLRDLVELAGARHVAADALLDGLPITMTALADPTTRVPLRVCEAIVTRAIARTGDPALAIELGLQMRVSSHGFLGFAAMTAGTVREALELAVKFSGTRTSAVGLALYVEGEIASLVIEERAPLGAIREFVVLMLLVGLAQLGAALTGMTPEGVGECAFPAPPYALPLASSGRLRFDRPLNRLVFPAHELAMTITSADVVATQLAREQCERELAALAETGLPGRIRAAIVARPDDGVIAIARAIHVSPRTLKRKLADHGTSFSMIRDDVRRSRALLLLDDRTLSVGEIATRLGYSELPNFTRAFRKWTGMTPVQYRSKGMRSVDDVTDTVR